MRLTRAKYADPPSVAFDGHGAAKHGQRWNAIGVRAAYASATLSLAALEYLGTLVDLNDAPDDLVTVAADLDESTIEIADISSIPGWNAIPADESVRFGTTWSRQRRSVALRVPSVMIPSENNFVLNPEHPDFYRAVVIHGAEPFVYDQRLLPPKR